MSSVSKDAREIFLVAIEQYAPDEWPRYLDEVCANDPELRQRVEILLEAHVGDESLLDIPAIAPPATIDQPISEKPGTQIGPYKLLQQIGKGGMGVVYLAEQKEPVKRRVALKIIKPGMDTCEVIARFEAERQALAMMDHPNIAKVLDAGQTDSGRPYFVMELVKGVPVTQYCDEKHLTPKERLELFIPICLAVQHAHQKGIIHRDIKPSNILVALFDGQAVPKVIDFGVAKATSQTLTEKTLFTRLGQVVGTLEYMSPEQTQVNQLDVDTRSDIYSMGVLLYELLTGDTPFDRRRMHSAALDEMLRIIREEEPLKPSTKVSSSESLPSIAANRRVEPQKLGTTIRGELDWIVMKALEKDRTQRYDTASSFGQDIQRYLSDETVVACPPSVSYRFRKFAKRNKRAIATGSLVAAALLVGIAGTTWQAIRATRSQQQAQRQLQEAKKAQQTTEQYLRRLIKTRAVAFASSGSLLAEKRDYEKARLQFQRALELDPESGMANNNYAWFLVTCPDAEFRNAHEALRLAARAIRLNSASGYFHNTLGVAHYRAGNTAEAVRALEESKRLMSDEAYSYNAFFLSMAYWQEGRKEAGRQIYEQAVDWMEEHEPSNSELLRFYVEATELLNSHKTIEPPL